LTTPASGSWTGNAAPTFAGAAGTASGDLSTITVRIYRGTTTTGTPLPTLGTFAAGRKWSLAPSAALADGTYTAQAQQADAAGNIGFSAPATFTIDTRPPMLTGGHPFAYLRGRAVIVDTGLTLVCPANGPGCAATVSGHLRNKGLDAATSVGQETAAVRAGRKVRITFQLTKHGSSLLRTRHRLRVQLTTRVTAGGLPPIVGTKSITIAAPHRARHK